MKRAAVVTSIALSLLSTPELRAAESKTGPMTRKAKAERLHKRSLEIRVQDGDWGNVTADEIKLLLTAVASELLAHFPDRELYPVIVSPSRRGPVVLYQKAPQNQYQVQLSARDKQWGEYVYEFAHELFHILANYDRHVLPDSLQHQWFEEMLCEAASLYALRHFSSRWEEVAPSKEWSEYAPALARFTHRALNAPQRRLPTDTTFVQWFQENARVLAENPYQREKNALIANLFLPLLEQEEDWGAIGFLNLAPPSAQTSFYDYLTGWYQTTPATHRGFITRTFRMFHLEPPLTHTSSANASIDGSPPRQ